MLVVDRKDYIVPILFLGHAVQVLMYYSDLAELCFDLTVTTLLIEILKSILLRKEKSLSPSPSPPSSLSL